MKKVQVLMSTYNGEKYLKEQINSILKQRNVEISLLIRDDGSKDGTVAVLKQFDNLSFIEGENIGYRKSFLQLMRDCEEADYYAFADQDDIWDEDKLILAVQTLEKSNNEFCLYCGNTRLVDEGLNFIKNENKDPKISLESALVKNFATGCTMVFNSGLLRKINEFAPQYVSSHDSWITRVCLALDGEVFFDSVPRMNYRQHGNNAIGASSGISGKIRYRMNLIMKDRSRSRKQTATILLEAYRDYLNYDRITVLEQFSRQTIIDKVRIILDSKCSCGKKLDDILFRFALICGWI